MQYTARAYLCTNFAGLMADMDTDSWSEVEDFIHENCMNGYNVEVTDNVSGDRNFVYADDYVRDFD